jgi:tetratricopeptide (TPR) repeat protein
VDIRSSFTLVVCACLLSLPATSRAEAPDTPTHSARADALFEQGRSELAAGHLAEACPLLAESYALDPATGCLLALALCHEREGKLATALHSYREAAERSQREGRADRERAARDKLAAIEARVSSLTLDLSALQEQPASEVRVNGALLSATERSRALPLDGGDVEVEVSSPGQQPWRTRVTLAASGDAHTLVVPALVALPQPPPPPTAAAQRVHTSTTAQPARDTARASRRSPTEWAGITLLSLSGAAFVTSIGFVLRANHQENANKIYCTPECGPEAEAAREASQRARDGALISGMLGLGVAVTGVVTYIWGRQQRPQHVHASAAPFITTRGAGASARLQF